jgi:selenoprotein W-related protein
LAALLEQRYGIRPRLIKSSGGVYEIKIGDELIWSKKQTRRFPDDQEVFSALDARVPHV